MILPARKFRTLLVLGRVSNLPTVWSNCLAAWLLNGGGKWPDFSLLCTSATLLYLGGMFLNDAFDAEFDRQFRKERPIPSGQISSRTVWLAGAGLLLFGWLCALVIGKAAALGALLLVVVIVLYDAVHKRTAAAPLLMASCRFFLYLTAGWSALNPLNQIIFWRGVVMAAYVAGLSFFARGESQPGILQRWPGLLLLAPLAANLSSPSNRTAFSWFASAVFLIWLCWSLRGLFSRRKPDIGGAVARLLAGIVLTDWSALTSPNYLIAGIFGGLFSLALLLQRKIPAT